jgi:hypothetical protein
MRAVKVPLNRAAQTAVFAWDIFISNRPFVDVCISFAAETGPRYGTVEKKKRNACRAPLLSGPHGRKLCFGAYRSPQMVIHPWIQ